jgi:ABC-type transporter Mla maintaining outer membrane lipid asymmetry ATPase subunit MlaF
VVRGPDLQVRRGGSSRWSAAGSNKSTLLREMILRIARMRARSVLGADRNPRGAQALRLRIGVMFQHGGCSVTDARERRPAAARHSAFRASIDEIAAWKIALAG